MKYEVGIEGFLGLSNQRAVINMITHCCTFDGITGLSQCQRRIHSIKDDQRLPLLQAGFADTRHVAFSAAIVDSKSVDFFHTFRYLSAIMAKQTDVLIQFGQRVRQLRQAQGLSQEDFGALCGLDRTYISSIERGKRNVGLKNVAAIASSLGVSISELFENTPGP